jgi:catechol 2,3-dioxygenase
MSVQSALTPRRIGHVNLYVGDWLRSLDFYASVAGLEEVFRETPIKAGFLSSGNTHHDIGFLEARAGERIGKDGFRQVAAGIGAQPGFNHFGIEMENEKELVEAYRRLRERKVPIERLSASEGLSKSIYLRDPDGNLLQFYADLTSNWRAFWGMGDRLVTGAWDPEQDKQPTQTSFYDPDPVLYRAPAAPFQPLRVTGGTLTVSDLAAAERFYREVGGFSPVWRSADRQTVLLSGKKLNRDLTLMAAQRGETPGLRQFSFKVASVAALAEGEAKLRRRGLSPEACLDHGLCKSVYVRDPDGFRVEFYADEVQDWPQWLAQGKPFNYPDGQPWEP